MSLQNSSKINIQPWFIVTAPTPIKAFRKNQFPQTVCQVLLAWHYWNMTLNANLKCETHCTSRCVPHSKYANRASKWSHSLVWGLCCVMALWSYSWVIYTVIKWIIKFSLQITSPDTYWNDEKSLELNVLQCEAHMHLPDKRLCCICSCRSTHRKKNMWH